MKPTRPVYLNLLQIRLPIPALVSILHRASGVILFLLLPFLLSLLSCSLRSEDNFNDLQQSLGLITRFFIWVTLSSLLYHLIAGIRHLIMDAGVGESLQTGRLTAKIVLALSIIGAILLGVWLW